MDADPQRPAREMVSGQDGAGGATGRYPLPVPPEGRHPTEARGVFTPVIVSFHDYLDLYFETPAFRLSKFSRAHGMDTLHGGRGPTPVARRHFIRSSPLRGEDDANHPSCPYLRRGCRSASRFSRFWVLGSGFQEHLGFKVSGFGEKWVSGVKCQENPNTETRHLEH